MASSSHAARGRIFYGWWVALAFSLIVFLSAGIRFTAGPFLKPVVSDLGLTGGYGAVFASACTLLLLATGLSLTINTVERPMRRELQPLAGGR